MQFINFIHTLLITGVTSQSNRKSIVSFDTLLNMEDGAISVEGSYCLTRYTEDMILEAIHACQLKRAISRIDQPNAPSEDV